MSILSVLLKSEICHFKHQSTLSSKITSKILNGQSPSFHLKNLNTEISIRKKWFQLWKNWQGPLISFPVEVPICFKKAHGQGDRHTVFNQKATFPGADLERAKFTEGEGERQTTNRPCLLIYQLESRHIYYAMKKHRSTWTHRGEVCVLSTAMQVIESDTLWPRPDYKAGLGH